jgi:hypothetical protein
MRPAWTRKVDGTVFAGPVIGGSGARRRVIVATEAGTVYALNATNGSVVWSRSITKPVPACGGTYGVSSTPALDVAHRVVYAIGAAGYLTALSLDDGSVRWRLQLVTRNTVEHVWSAVRLVGSSAYVAVASYCDAPDKDKKPPDGYLLRVDLAHHKVTAKFDVVPGPDNLGGIWSWGGVSVDPATGAIFTSTGNSIVTSEGSLIEGAGHAERVLQLTPSLRVADETPPQTLAAENRGDEDFGATPLLFHPTGCPALVAANSKNGRTYAWRRGGLSKAPVFDAKLGPTRPGDPFLGQPTYIPALHLLVIAQTVFGTGTRGISAYAISSKCTFARRWDLNIGGGPQPPPIAIGGVLVASAPASQDVKLIDAKTGVIIAALDPGQPVVAPLASDGRSIFAATTAGTITMYSPR